MLSIGKHPPDPPCACDELTHPPLNSDERASPKSPQLPDLTRNPSLPNFSIRNYVFASRHRNVSTNWPFSLKNLQLCLKHGVKDPLPPFQSVDNVRTRSGDSSSLMKAVSRSNSTEESLRPSNDDADNTRSNIGLADHNFPSTTTSFSQLETESVPTKRRSNNSSVSVERGTLLVTSAEKEVAGPTVPRKSDTAVRSVGKKGRPVVKLGGNLERISTDDIASTSSAISETMASKVCPVCKTFSSSSNTTLNAHIDQCLSEEPTPKWSAGSKPIRHRIKPRKTRLMVDIYETAIHCTLEDLDRRNGSNWAAVTSLPCQDTEEKRQRFSPITREKDAGAVYIDSNGRKLRILSRFSDSQPSPSRVDEALGPGNCLKGKGNKIFLSKKKMKRRKKKKKQNAQKNHAYLRLVSRSKDFRSRKLQLRGSQDFRGRGKPRGATGGTEDIHLTVSRSQSPLPVRDSGTLKQWACSKRSGPVKKAGDKDQHPPQQCTLHVARKLLVEHGRLCFRNELISSDGPDSDSSEDSRDSERMGVRVIEGEFPRKRKARSPLFFGRADRTVEGSSFVPMKRRESQFSDPLSSGGGCDQFHGSSKPSITPVVDGKSSKGSGISPTKRAMKFSRMEKKKKMLSTRTFRRLKSDGVKGSTRDRKESLLMRESDEDGQQGDLVSTPLEETSNKMSLARSFVGGFRRGTENTSDFQEPLYSDSDKEKNAESSLSLSNDQSEKMGGSDSVANTGRDHEDDCRGDGIDAFELQSKLGDEDSVSDFSKYLNHGNPIENRRVHARASTEAYKGSLCLTECPTFQPEDEDMSRPASDINMDLDAQALKPYEDAGILIPGPPGSFLPSPGARGSEEFQGNSSLTSSRVQSSRQDLVDGGSSDSPVSATSTVSNSASAGPGVKCVGPPVSEVPPQPLEEKSLSSISSGGFDGVETLVLNAASSAHPSAMGVSSERKNIEKGQLISKNDDQPCCCQRKERTSHGIILTHQDSQLLRRRNLGSLSAIRLGKRLSRSPSTGSVHAEGRPEMLLPPSASKDFENQTTKPFSAPLTSSHGLANNGAKAFDVGESEPATPSVCNPVLRLMGKNLLVVNKEDNASAAPVVERSDSAGPWSNNSLIDSQGSRMTGVSYNGPPPVPSSGYRPPAAPPGGMPANWHVSGYRNDTFYSPNQPPRSNAVLVPEHRDPRPMKEIIIIDDSPEDERMPAKVGIMRGRQAAAAPFPQAVPFPARTTTGGGYDPRLAGGFPFSSYPSPQDHPSYFRQISHPFSRHTGPRPSGIQWCSSSPDGSFQRAGHTVPAPPPPNIHIRSSPLPYSPGRR